MSSWPRPSLSSIQLTVCCTKNNKRQVITKWLWPKPYQSIAQIAQITNCFIPCFIKKLYLSFYVHIICVHGPDSFKRVFSRLTIRFACEQVVRESPEPNLLHEQTSRQVLVQEFIIICTWHEHKNHSQTRVYFNKIISCDHFLTIIKSLPIIKPKDSNRIYF